MPRWLLIVLLVGVAAYGWHTTAQQRARGAHEVVAVNKSGRPLEDVQIDVGGRRLEVATLAPGASARLPLRAERDGAFDVSWRPRGADQERHWSGGRFTHGPLRMRHRFEFVRGDGIVWRIERRPARR